MVTRPVWGRKGAVEGILRRHFYSGASHESNFGCIRDCLAGLSEDVQERRGEGGACRTSVAVMSHLSAGSEQSETTGRSVTALVFASFRGFLKITFYYITIIFNVQ